MAGLNDFPLDVFVESMFGDKESQKAEEKKYRKQRFSL